MRNAMQTALLLLFALAAACSEPTSGPARVVWSRHACDHCGMAISEPRFAAQARLGPHEVLRFDDFGCLVEWLAAQTSEGDVAELWVMDMDGEAWLDARRAFYRPGQRTPMAHGFGAIARAEPGALDFEAASAAILAKKKERAAHGRP